MKMKRNGPLPSILLTLAMVLGLLPVSALAAEGISNSGQIHEEEYTIVYKCGDDFTLTPEEGAEEYVGAPLNGHTFVGIKQATWSIVYTGLDLTDEEWADMQQAILARNKGQGNLSPGKQVMRFDGCPDTYTNTGKGGSATYYVVELDGEIYVLAPNTGSVSHFYFGDYGVEPEEPDETPEPSETPEPEEPKSSRKSRPQPEEVLEIGEPEVPLAVLPEPEETVTLEEPEVPLALLPEPEEPQPEIVEEPTPLGELPQTGMTAAPAAGMTAVLAACAACLTLAGAALLRRREDEK